MQSTDRRGPTGAQEQGVDTLNRPFLSGLECQTFLCPVYTPKRGNGRKSEVNHSRNNGSWAFIFLEKQFPE